MVGSDAVGDLLQQDRLAGEGGGDDEAALAFADGRDEIHDTHGNLFLAHFQDEALVRVDGRQAVEDDALVGDFGRLVVDRLHFQQREIALALFRRPHVSGDAVARAQRKLADLRGGDVDIIGTGEVGVVGGAKEAEAVGEDFEGALAVYGARFFDAALEHRENQVLLLEAAVLFDAQGRRRLIQLGHGHGLEIGNIQFRSVHGIRYHFIGHIQHGRGIAPLLVLLGSPSAAGPSGPIVVVIAAAIASAGAVATTTATAAATLLRPGAVGVAFGVVVAALVLRTPRTTFGGCLFCHAYFLSLFLHLEAPRVGQ